MRIQPIDIYPPTLREPNRIESGKPVMKSRLRKLFDRPFTTALRISSPEKIAWESNSKDGERLEFEPTSVCLAKMVQNFIEESNEKQPKSNRNSCNCFNATGDESSDDEFDEFGVFGEPNHPSGPSGYDTSVTLLLKSFMTGASVAERSLLSDAAAILENNTIEKRKDDLRKILTDELSSLGYDSSICTSKWEKSSSFPAGVYEFIDVIVGGERFLLDVDFRSEFEIARPTAKYKAVLQSLPYLFIGKPDRLAQLVSTISEAAKQSLKKKGMPLPPWRKVEYMQAKWLSPYTRTPTPKPPENCQPATEIRREDNASTSMDETTSSEPDSTVSIETDFFPSPPENSKAKETTPAWKLPEIWPGVVERGPKFVAGFDIRSPVATLEK